MGNSDSRRKLWDTRYKSGKCVYCGKNPSITDRKGCEPCLKRQVKINNKYSKSNRDKINKYHLKVRQEVIIKYGGQCACCEEKCWHFLAIDHINQDGGEERKKLYGSQSGNSSSWFMKLRREPIRDDLRVLCHNCNMATYQFGECPHEQRKEIS